MSKRVAVAPVPKQPAGFPVAACWSVLLATALSALAIIAVRDGLIDTGVLSGDQWLATALRNLDGMRPHGWMLIVAAGSVVVGLLLLIAALSPRPHNLVRLKTRSGVFVTTKSAKVLARSAAQEVDGVMAAKVTAGKRRVRVVATATKSSIEIKQKVSASVTDALSPLAKAMSVSIKIKEEKLQ